MDRESLAGPNPEDIRRAEDAEDNRAGRDSFACWNIHAGEFWWDDAGRIKNSPWGEESIRHWHGTLRRDCFGWTFISDQAPGSSSRPDGIGISLSPSDADSRGLNREKHGLAAEPGNGRPAQEDAASAITARRPERP